VAAHGPPPEASIAKKAPAETSKSMAIEAGAAATPLADVSASARCALGFLVAGLKAQPTLEGASFPRFDQSGSG